MPTSFLPEPWWRFAVALVIGALIGLEREFIQQKSGYADFAGLRTFALTGLLGAITGYLTPVIGLMPAALAMLGIILLAVASEITGNYGKGITTEVSILLVFLLGGMVFWDRVEVAIALGVVVAVLLSLKLELQSVVRAMSSEDLRATLQFAFVSAVILPLLPNQTVDPFNLINPFQLWLFVVFVLGIGFIGYVLIKLLGAERGASITALTGGIVSSTATTLSFATRSKQNEALSSLYAQAILLASSVMLPRLALTLLVIYRPLVLAVIIPLTAMLIAGLAATNLLWRSRKRRGEDEDDQHAVEVSNPLKLSTAVTFGLLFAVVLVIVRFAQATFGNVGVYITSVLAGLTDVDAISLSVANLAAGGQIELEVAAVAVVIAAIMNTLSKGVIAYSVGSPALRKALLPTFGAMVAAGVISGLITFLVL